MSGSVLHEADPSSTSVVFQINGRCLKHELGRVELFIVEEADFGEVTVSSVTAGVTSHNHLNVNIHIEMTIKNNDN